MVDHLVFAVAAVLAIPAFTLAAVACLSADPRRGGGVRRRFDADGHARAIR